jgi:hypothetical protein
MQGSATTMEVRWDDVHVCVRTSVLLPLNPGSGGPRCAASGVLQRSHRVHDWRGELPGVRVAGHLGLARAAAKEHRVRGDGTAVRGQLHTAAGTTGTAKRRSVRGGWGMALVRLWVDVEQTLRRRWPFLGFVILEHFFYSPFFVCAARRCGGSRVTSTHRTLVRRSLAVHPFHPLAKGVTSFGAQSKKDFMGY